MGLFKHLRHKIRSEDVTSPRRYAPEQTSEDLTQNLPLDILEIIFAHVCPHTRDQSFLTCEDVPTSSDCMLCDLRDLAHCTQVCSRWREIAERILYGSIRIDAVHYCILEEELALRRNKTGRFKKSKYIDPVEIPGIRLASLCRTLRENRALAEHVQYLKLPFMTRESSRADLARAVAALPNLRYVDLPESFYSGHDTSDVLRNELQARCPKLARMQYRKGSEAHLDHLLQRRWQHLESLELKSVATDIGTLQLVLASLPRLHDLTLSDLPWLDDTLFAQDSQYAIFPSIEVLKLEDTPEITTKGLIKHLSQHHNQQALLSMTLCNTGVLISALHNVLWKATHLEHLAVSQTTSKPLVIHKDTPFLTSPSLRTLTYEIYNAEGVRGLQRPSDSYYAYLASSLYASALPALTTLYVRERQFPERLMPSIVGLAGNTSQLSLLSHASRHDGFNQTLRVFSKDADEVQWLATPFAGVSGRRLSTASSSHQVSTSSELIPPWARGGLEGNPRSSVVISNGHGAFLTLPEDDASMPYGSDAQAGANEYDEHLRPPPSLALLKAKRASRNDLWR